MSHGKINFQTISFLCVLKSVYLRHMSVFLMLCFNVSLEGRFCLLAGLLIERCGFFLKGEAVVCVKPKLNKLVSVFPQM